MNEELLKTLSNPNINSETAEQISNAWLNYCYLNMLREEIAGWTVFLCIVFGVRAVWKRYKETN